MLTDEKSSTYKYLLSNVMKRKFKVRNNRNVKVLEPRWWVSNISDKRSLIFVLSGNVGTFCCFLLFLTVNEEFWGFHRLFRVKKQIKDVTLSSDNHKLIHVKSIFSGFRTSDRSIDHRKASLTRFCSSQASDYQWISDVSPHRSNPNPTCASARVPFSFLLLNYCSANSGSGSGAVFSFLPFSFHLISAADARSFARKVYLQTHKQTVLWVYRPNTNVGHNRGHGATVSPRAAMFGR